MSKSIRNIAIIAHVDHGKTTLIDAILRQTGVFRKNQQLVERVMDSNVLERERGITIFSKNAAFEYRGTKINIVDTPGHADFGGEVQRVLKMVDSVLLIVDAFEGPMPQTKYVLQKSLQLDLKPLVVINKIDRPNARPHEVLTAVFDLFVELNASDEQLDFPVIYTSAKNGVAKMQIDDQSEDMTPLLEAVITQVKEPDGDPAGPLQMLISAIDYDNFVGQLGTGKIHQGMICNGDTVALIRCDGRVESFKVSRLYTYNGLKRQEVERALAGDIVTVAGADAVHVGETIAHRDHAQAIPIMHIDEPTMAMTFMVNDSPLAGNVGKYLTSRHLENRLRRELLTNVNLRLEEGEFKGSFVIKGRGTLQLSILIENMRREGYEFAVSPPRVIEKTVDGRRLEPIEQAVVDVADDYAGVVIEMFGLRKGELKSMNRGGDGYTRLEFLIPARGLIGCNSEFLTATRGTGILNHSFWAYEEYRGDTRRKTKGVLISLETGTSITYALYNLQERGQLFIPPGVAVYPGMIVGEHCKENDLVVNACKTKKLTNMRAAGSDEALRLSPPRQFSIEQALEYINEDELLEVAGQDLRMRKQILDHNLRKRSEKQKESA